MEISEQLKKVYSEPCMSVVMAGKWVKLFFEGRTDIHDSWHSGSLLDSMPSDKM